MQRDLRKNNCRNVLSFAHKVRLALVGARLQPDASRNRSSWRAYATIAKTEYLDRRNVNVVSPSLGIALRPRRCNPRAENLYNIAHRDDDAFIDNLAQRGIAYVPFFPLGGFNPFQSATLDGVCRFVRRNGNASCARWVAPTLTQYFVDSRNLVGATPAGESPSRNIDVAIGHARHTRAPWHEVSTKT